MIIIIKATHKSILKIFPNLSGIVLKQYSFLSITRDSDLKGYRVSFIFARKA